MNGSFDRASATGAEIPELQVDYEDRPKPVSPRIDNGFAEFRTSVLLERSGFRHAFFTRRGGVSVGPYSSLSFSLAVGDAPEAVTENLERAARALGVASSRVQFLSQVHGTGVVVTDGQDDRTELIHREGDAVVSRDPRCAAAVRIADCVPILVADRKSGTVCAIHAGWKGLALGVIESGVTKLRDVAGSEGDLVAVIGPHITLAAFEVSEDVAETLAACAPGTNVVDRTLGPKPHVSLARIARTKLAALGLKDADVDQLPGCTYTDGDAFFSFRRDGKTSGRHLAAIVPREARGLGQSG
jgi:YfiH family protein